MRHLHVDIETKATQDVTEVGVYRMVECPDFAITIFSYQWDHGPTHAIDCYYEDVAGESIPPDVMGALRGDAGYEDVILWAHNANFEIVCINKYYGLDMDVRRWRCTMIAAAYLGLPMKLEILAKVLQLPEQKDERGDELIKFFAQPNAKLSAKDDFRIWNTPRGAPEKWAEFLAYGAQDVRTEVAVHDYTLRFPAMPDIEWAYWRQDQVINGRGIRIDVPLIKEVIAILGPELQRIHTEMRAISGIANPNSLPQIKAWLFKETGEWVPSLDKEYLEAVDYSILPDHVARLLRLRGMANKTSTSKFQKMLDMMCADGCVRGIIQFYGANRTGRYAGRLVQGQNLKKTFSNEKQRRQAPHLIDDALVIARRAIMSGVAGLLYDNVPDLISRMVRTAFISREGCSFPISDYKSIEARIIAWLAGEERVLDAFRAGIDIYVAEASAMFNIPLHLVDSDQRGKGKVTTLSLGYQGWVGALIKMGALRMGLKEEELPSLAKGWRNTHPKTCKMWKQFEAAFKHVIKNKSVYTLRLPYTSIKFSYEKKYVFITLPSGRRLAYYGAHLSKSGGIRFWGLDQVKKIWRVQDTYGGSLVENVTQAIARDVLADAMHRAKDDIDILMHIHDEVVPEAKDEEAEETLAYLNGVMAVGPDWAEGLPLGGSGYTTKFYRKDD